MPLSTPIYPGRVDWSGENPGILLKKRKDGPWSAMALFFRIVYSPAGQGQALLLYEAPDQAASLPAVHNVMVSDNRDMAEYLMTNFIGKLPSFGGQPAFAHVQHLALDKAVAGGDPRTRYTETVVSGSLEVELVWDELGVPVALELPVEATGTKEHEGFTVLVESRDAAIVVNGRALPGRPARRVQAGLETTTAFLYFSETWVWPAHEHA